MREIAGAPYELIGWMPERARAAVAAIRARVADTRDVALAAPGVTATVFVMSGNGRFHRCHLLAGVRRHRNLLAGAGLHEVAVEVRTAVLTDAPLLPVLSGPAEAAAVTGRVGRDSATAWISEQQERAFTGRLSVAIPVCVASVTEGAR
ncbi:hypothetical protein [Streptomyces litmocidini]|uniref:hypothetical protein n=1 Tax=Streptomyces litmocidini TaxID=67318 RepID=UPI00167EE466|nr:hypothetical protein [Streptomyces litmocidini]